MLSKALEMGVCFHTGTAFGEHGGALLGSMEGHFFLGLLREKLFREIFVWLSI